MRRALIALLCGVGIATLSAQTRRPLAGGAFAPSADYDIAGRWDFAIVPTVNGAPILTGSQTSGTGDITGPASATDNAIARFDGITGKILQDYTSGAPTISDTGNLIFNSASNSRPWELNSTLTGEGVRFGFLYNKGSWANGGAGGTDAYFDDVMTWGWNLGASTSVPGVAGKASVYHVLENKFWFNGKYISEVHLELDDTSGTTHRTETWGLPHDGGTGSLHGVTIDLINWYKWDGTQTIKWDLVNNLATIGSFATGFKMAFANNNAAIIQQRNAADGAYLNLPFFNADDRLATTAGASFVGATPTTGTYANQFFVLQPTALAANGRALEISLPTVTGAQNGIQIDGSPTTGLNNVWTNSSATSTANVKLSLAVQGSSGGDPFINFDIPGQRDYSMGIDNSDGDKFKISIATSLSGSDIFIIDGANSAVAIGATTPNANAILDVNSTTKAFMPPRMTTTQRDAISSPTAGMVIYNSSTGKLNVYTTAWEAVTSS